MINLFGDSNLQRFGCFCLYCINILKINKYYLSLLEDIWSKRLYCRDCKGLGASEFYVSFYILRLYKIMKGKKVFSTDL